GGGFCVRGKHLCALLLPWKQTARPQQNYSGASRSIATMASSSAPSQDIVMTDGPQLPATPPEPKFGGFTRFEIELEFVQSLSNPFYLNHLAVQKYLESPPFIAYLAYLQYFAHPPYTRYLTYPGPTLRNLELLQQERFRTEILSPDVVARLVEEGVKAGMTYPRR
ncbi:hypothetical protein DH86_00003256, partial [Scytalidium sp. 3C]